jgi:GWxTD domain-containing protein
MMRVTLSVILFLLLVPGCTGPKTAVSRSDTGTRSGMYNPASTKLHPSYSVFHFSDSTSLLMVKIFPSELLFNAANADRKMIARLKIDFDLTDITDHNNTMLVDSGAKEYVVQKENADKRFIVQIPVRAVRNRVYDLRVGARDLLRNEINTDYVIVEKRSRFSQQNFMVREAAHNLPYFDPLVIGATTFKIEFPADTFSRVFISYYGQESPLPRPSFSLTREREFMEKPDSLWIIPYQKNTLFQLGYEGIYQFRFDTTLPEGLSVYNFGPVFPRIKQPQQMIDPLAYLTSSVEYDAIRHSANPKLAVDNFWLSLTGDDMGRARELIRVYYNRVYFANYYFTTFKPGWKTDRGMIYIIYGPPQAVSRSSGSEKWIYYKNNYANTLTFIFDYVPSTFTCDNFILQRSEGYDSYWRQAIDTWRKGSVFMIE